MILLWIHLSFSFLIFLFDRDLIKDIWDTIFHKKPFRYIADYLLWSLVPVMNLALLYLVITELIIDVQYKRQQALLFAQKPYAASYDKICKVNHQFNELFLSPSGIHQASLVDKEIRDYYRDFSHLEKIPDNPNIIHLYLRYEPVFEDLSLFLRHQLQIKGDPQFYLHVYANLVDLFLAEYECAQYPSLTEVL